MPELTIEQALQLAVQHHQSNRLAEAEAAYRHVLARRPDHPVAQYFFARLLGQRGQRAEAVELLKRNIATHPGVVEPRIALGEFLRLLGQLDESIVTLVQAAQMAPQNADAHNSLGNSLRERGRVDEAVTEFRKALALMPAYAEAYSNLGNALRALGDFGGSIAAHEEALRLKPDSAEIHNNFGIALKEKGDLDGCIVAFSRAIELRPNYSEALNNLGGALVTDGRLDEALAAFSKAAELQPESPDVHNNLGNVLKEKGRLDESVAAYERALRLRPDFAAVYSNLGINLMSQGRLDAAIESFRRAMHHCPDMPQYFGNLLYTLYFHPEYDAQAILRQHLEWARRYIEPLSSTIAVHSNDPAPDRRLRIGYVSADFREHPVGRFLLPLLAHHDHDGHEIFCYSGVRVADELTNRLQSHADQWRDIAGLSDATAAELIRRDRIDVLVDLTLHMAGSRLLVFARKPAPVQVTWLGYVGTTGLKSIDFRISDAYLDPRSASSGQAPGSEGDYVERTVHLPQSYWCYEAPVVAPEVNTLPAFTTGHVTFGCFNNFAKASTPALELWAKILAAVPRSRLLIHSHAGSHLDGVRNLFARAGVDPERLGFIAFLPTNEYMRQHHHIDIALDPFPYGGGTTTCDALWMGVPVVTLSGRTAVGRAGVSILSNVGLPQFIAKTPEQYVSIAMQLAGNLPKLAGLRAALRQRMRQSPLMDAPRFAKDVEDAFRKLWINWCDTRSGTGSR